MKAVLPFAVAAALAFAGGYGFGRFDALPSEPAPGGPAAAPGDAAAPAASPHYVEAGQLIVPMLEQGRTVAFILTQVTLEAASADDALAVRRRLPHARSAMLEALFDLAGHGRFNGPSVDPHGVAAALLASANGSFAGPEGGQQAGGVRPVRSVLIDRLLRQDNTRL
ncbi:hypothetical protein ABMY26_12065 [Azospirillum sp. HJ39]|uniref:hypothetical protein n=1 Tax=Azospirillum sp. HJ39 TaxID=3159496 RepID=UPI003558D994